MLSHLKDSRIQFPSLQSFATRTENTSQRVLVSHSVQIAPSTPILVYIGVDLWPDAVQPTNDGQAAGVYILTVVSRFMSNDWLFQEESTRTRLVWESQPKTRKLRRS